jgi:hypothetical protein
MAKLVMSRFVGRNEREHLSDVISPRAFLIITISGCVTAEMVGGHRQKAAWLAVDAAK